jgi:hypothetical protein
MNRYSNALFAALVSVGGVVGCAAAEAPAPSDEALDAEETIGEQQIVYSNGWSANAIAPDAWGGAGGSYAIASVSLTGSGTRRAGVCLLQKTTTACNTAADCNGIPVNAGGFRYCTAPNNTGTKYCYIRNGTNAAWCGGTPANGALVAPGTVNTPAVRISKLNTFISYACFEGCAVTDPSSSSPSIYVSNNN